MNDDNNSQQQQSPQQQNRGNKPVDTIRDGSLKVAIFKNQRENGVSFSLEAGRVYTDQQGNFKEAKSFSSNESLRVARLFEKGYDRVEQFKTQQKQESKNVDRER